MRRHTKPGTAAPTLGGALLLAALGCASIVSRVPLVTPAMTAAAVGSGVEPAALDRGREIYLNRCTRCHGPVAIAGRTPRQWDAILPRMAAESQLDSSATADLTAYIQAVGAVAAVGSVDGH